MNLGSTRGSRVGFRGLAKTFLLLFLTATVSHAGGVDQVDRWSSAHVNTRDLLRLDKAVAFFQRTHTRYEVIQRMRSNGAPAPVLFGLHYRESDNNFAAHPHNGDPLTHRTRNEPAGRLPNAPPPYRFEQSAEDAYYVVDRLDRTDWRDLQDSLDRIEKFNGLGYRHKGIAAPYLWSGTNLYSRGKYVSDGRYSPTALDAQLGVAAILKRMRDRGITIPF